jgi:TPR repeat protein
MMMYYIKAVDEYYMVSAYMDIGYICKLGVGVEIHYQKAIAHYKIIANNG